MNILIFPSEDNIQGRVSVTGQQFTHLTHVLKVKIGDTIKVGELNGDMGIGLVSHIDDTSIQLNVDLKHKPEPQLPLALVIALPRPQMIKRILQTVATMGVEHIHFVQTQKVEKNYWQSPTVTEQSINEQLYLGLEQGGHTHCPKVTKHTHWSHFLNTTLNDIQQNYTHHFVAHLTPTTPCPSFFKKPENKTLMFIGPEGGFTDQEIDQLNERNIQTVQLGNRILRVETAVTALITKLYY